MKAYVLVEIPEGDVAEYSIDYVVSKGTEVIEKKQTELKILPLKMGNSVPKEVKGFADGWNKCISKIEE